MLLGDGGRGHAVKSRQLEEIITVVIGDDLVTCFTERCGLECIGCRVVQAVLVTIAQAGLYVEQVACLGQGDANSWCCLCLHC